LSRDNDHQPPNAHVLLIEDDPQVAEMYRIGLDMGGYRVTVATDGEAGLRLALESSPDLTLLDYRLPKLDGAAVLRALRADARTRSLRVLVLSAYDEPSVISGAMAMGALDWLVKTRVTPQQLAAQVRRWITMPAQYPNENIS